MKPSLFSKLSLLVVALVSVGILFWLSEQIAPAVSTQNPLAATPSTAATTTSSSADTQTSGTDGEDNAAPTPAAAVALNESLPLSYIKTPRGLIYARTATTDGERDQGLSDRPSLPQDGGMLFVFPTPDAYGFWMKDMQFSLDMVWIGTNKQVVAVTPDLSPQTYPATFFPPSPVTYVLELNSGAAAKLGIATGTQLVF